MIAAIASGLGWAFLWYLGLSSVAALIEYRWPADGRTGVGHRLVNFGVCFIDAILLAAFTQLVASLPETLRLHGLLGPLFDAWPIDNVGMAIVATLIVAFVWDFFQYWCHRLQHAFPILWLAHAPHHDDAEMDGTTALRRSFPEHLINYALITVPTLIVCGVHLLPLIGSIILFRCWGFFNHANVRLDLGPLTAIISGPQWHRLHHDRAVDRGGTNFAAFFPILDIIFGTYRKPEQAEFPSTGVKDRPPRRNRAGAVLATVLALP